MPATVFAQDEVLTGEAVALDVQPIGFFLRALGALIDVLVGIVVIVLLGLAAVWAVDRGVLPTSTTGILTIAVIVLGTVVLPATVETATHGRSLGRLAVGGRIVRADGG
ncbi:MAG TPA: RDD family protein, partial [Microbacterium sp.]|nr:RDD family protein [Microbacterium sp.]